MKPRRFLGLELSGAKNSKTGLAALEYYPREKKIFLLDLYEKIVPREGQTSDDAVIELIREHAGESGKGIELLGVNVPLSLPPCITCTRKTCPTPARCVVPEVKWMREQTKRAQKSGDLKHAGIRALDFTPYTQRPVELWTRYHVFAELPAHARFEIDETLGGNRAPLAARMHYLKWHLGQIPLIEVWPKLTVAILADQCKLPRRILTSYRQLESGAHARLEILEAWARDFGLFIYERDQNKLAENLSAFDAFVCAFGALLAGTERSAERPKGFPALGGWVDYPL